MGQARRELDFTLQLETPELGSWRDRLQGTGRLRILPALNEDAAGALRAELSASADWALSWRQGTAEREADAATLARLNPAQLAALEAFARAGDEHTFRFMHDVIRVSPKAEVRAARGTLLDRYVDALNAPETLDKIGALTGETICCFNGDATRYRPGHFLTTHNDGRKHGKRVAALVLNLTPWHIDWGGLMLFHDPGAQSATAWVPQFNTANLFLVPQDHSVTWVNALAPQPRIAVAGGSTPIRPPA